MPILLIIICAIIAVILALLLIVGYFYIEKTLGRHIAIIYALFIFGLLIYATYGL